MQSARSGSESETQALEINLGHLRLPGDLSKPPTPGGTVVFAHGSGSSRHSPRNRAVARVLNAKGLATLLFDLLTPEEESDRSNVFNIELLAERLVQATYPLSDAADGEGQAIGYFGASTGAAAALWAAADLRDRIRAVVSRGGRPDLAMHRLQDVNAPTLLIVGERDSTVLDLNREAQARLKCENRLEIVPGATHLFEEPGALQMVSDLAAGWFVRHLPRS